MAKPKIFCTPSLTKNFDLSNGHKVEKSILIALMPPLRQAAAPPRAAALHTWASEDNPTGIRGWKTAVAY